MTWTTANMQRVLASRGWLPDGDPVRTPAYKKNYYTGEIATLNESVTEKRLKRPVSVFIYAADHETTISAYRWPSMLSFLEAVVAGVYMTPHAPNDEMAAPDPPRQQAEEGTQPSGFASRSFFGELDTIRPPTPADALSWEAFCRNESGPTYMVPVPVNDDDLALELGTNYTVPGYGEGVVHSRNRTDRRLTIRFDRHDEYAIYPLSGSASAAELYHYRDGHRVRIDVNGRARWGRVAGGGPTRMPDHDGYAVRVLLDREPWREPDAAPDTVVEYITDESYNGMRPRTGQRWFITNGGGRQGTIQSVTWQPQRDRWAVRVAVDAPQQQPAPSRGLEAWLPRSYTPSAPTPAFIEAARQQLDRSIAASQRAMAASLYTSPSGQYTIGYTGGSLSGQLSGHQHAVISRDEVPPAAVPSLSIPEQVVAAAHEQAERLRRAFHNPMAAVVPGRRRRNP